MEPSTTTSGVSNDAHIHFTIGADPELFLVSNGDFKSSIGLVGGSKFAPRPLGERAGYFVQEDNVAVEFNIPPANTLAEFCDSIAYGVKKITEEVDKFGVKPEAIASALFPPTELASPAAQQFGCDPDFNAWKDGRRNPRPRAKSERLRSCGGHIHVGYPTSTNIDPLRAIQLMDLYLGVPSVLMDEDQQRRQLYGKAGSFRKTDYGFEYRTLSNFWLREPKLTEWAYTQTIRALNRAVKFGKRPEKGKDDYSEFMERYDLCDMIPKAINKSNVNLSHRLVTHYDLDVR